MDRTRTRRRAGRSRVLLAAALLTAVGCSESRQATLEPTPSRARSAAPTPARETRIDVSSLPGRIVFSAGPSYHEDVYVVDADGTGLTRVTRDPAADFDPTWSPDGRRIAYRHQSGEGDEGTAEIYAIDVDGSRATNLTRSDGVADWGPAWSPDGSLIAWNSDAHGGGMDLHGFAMRPNGSKTWTITDRIFFEYPAWSPDGERIAFMSQVPEEGFDYEIFVMDADGTDISRLTDSAGDDGWPSWSPDGTRILFTSQRDDCSFSDASDCLTTGDVGPFHTLYVMGADGSKQTRVSEVFGQIADWSPDGRYIVFEDFAGRTGLSVMRADGSGLTTIPVDLPSPLFPDWIR